MKAGVPASRVGQAPLVFVFPILVAIIAAGIALWSAGPYMVGVFHDDGVYALLAQSLASGHGFHYSNLPGSPAAIHYPPLYPLLLSVLWRVAPSFPENVPALVSFNALLVGACAAGWWRFATRVEGWRAWTAAVAALACSLTLPTLALANALLSETLFLALLWPSLMLSERAATNDDTRGHLWAGAAVGLLMLVRTHAIALLGGLVLVLLVRRRWRGAGFVLAASLAIQLPWLLWSAFATPRLAAPLEGAYGSYLGWFLAGLRDGGVSFLGRSIRMNAGECWLYINDRIAAGFPPFLQFAVAGIVTVAAVIGLWSLWQRARVTVLFLVLYSAIVLVWPYNPWRFIWAVWPLLGLVVFSGVRHAWGVTGRFRPAVAVAVLLPLAAVLRVELHSYAAHEWRSAARDGAAQIAPVLGWIERHAAPDDVILTEGEPVVSLYLGHRAAPPSTFTAREYVMPTSAEEGAGRLHEMMVAVPARFVIVFAPSTLRSADMLAASHPGLRRIEPIGGGAVYEVVP